MNEKVGIYQVNPTWQDLVHRVANIPGDPPRAIQIYYPSPPQLSFEFLRYFRLITCTLHRITPKLIYLSLTFILFVSMVLFCGYGSGTSS